MSALDRIDPALRPSLDQVQTMFPGGLNTVDDLTARRSALSNLSDVLPGSDNRRVIKENRTIPGIDGSDDLTVRIYRPADRTGLLPGIYNIHGGGMIMGTAESDDPLAEQLCTELQAVVVSVDYRVAPENPHPAPIEDCYAGYTWMLANADELGFVRDRVAIHSVSAGGGLTLGLALLARDRGSTLPRLQMALSPMVDPANDTPSSHEITDLDTWDRSTNIKAWQWYLNGREPDAYAAPAHASDLTGLPPTFIDVGTVDLFRDEDIRFATRLMQAGVHTELAVYPGVFHGAESIAPNAPVAQQMRTRRIETLRRALTDPPN